MHLKAAHCRGASKSGGINPGSAAAIVRKSLKASLRFIALLTLAGTAMAADYSWLPNPMSGGNWVSGTTWMNSGTYAAYPNAIGDVGIITGSIGANIPIAVNQPVTLGVLNFAQTGGTAGGVGATISRSTTTNGGVNFITLDNGGSNSQVNLQYLNSSFTLTAPLILNGNLDVTTNLSGANSAGRTQTLSSALVSSAPRNITVTDNNGAISGNRTGIAVGFGYDRFQGNILLRGTCAPQGNSFIEIASNIPAYVGLDIDTSTYIRPTNVVVSGTINLGSATTRFAQNQSNAGNTNFRMAGKVVGGGSNAILSFEGPAAQFYFDGAANNFLGRIRISAYDNPNVWITKDSQLGDLSNPVEFAGASSNAAAPGGGLCIGENVTTSRTIEVGANSTSQASIAEIYVENGKTLTLNGGAGQITRSATNTNNSQALLKTGGGTMVISGNSTFGGDYFRGNNNLVSGILRIDNTATNINNRLATTATAGQLRLSDGRLEFAGGTSGAQVETIKRDLRPMVGSSEVFAGNGSGQTSTITFASLTRTGSTAIAQQGRGIFPNLNFGALDGSAGALGSADNQIKFLTAPTLSNGIIGAWARVGSDWASYGSNGVAAYAGYTPFGSAGAADNAELTASAVLPGAQSVNSLKINGDNLDLNLNGNTLTVASGGILNAGNTNTLSGAGSIALGTELIVTDNGSLNISAALENYVFTKAGTGTTVLSAAANNQVATIVNEGILSVATDAQLGGAITYGTASTGYVAIAGGVLRLADGLTTSRPLVLGASGSDTATLDALGPFSRNEVNVLSGTVSWNGKITGGAGTGAPAFVKTGSGVLVVGNPNTGSSNCFGLVGGTNGVGVNDFIGNVVIREGALRLLTWAQLGNSIGGSNTNDIVFQGGTFEANGNTVAGPTLNGGVNQRSLYVEQGGGTWKAINLTGAGATLTIVGSEGVVYRGANAGRFNIMEDAASNGAANLSVTYGGAVTDAQGSAAQVYRVTGTASNYRGTTSIAAGTVLVEGDALNGADGVFGNATSAVIVGSSSQSAGSNVLVLTNTANITIGRPITVQNNNISGLGSSTVLGGAHTSGTSIWSSAINTARPISLAAEAGGTVVFSGTIVDNTLECSITKVGGGTVELTSGNTFRGGAIIAQGVMKANNPTGSATGTNAVSVLAGATLAGSGSIAGSTTIAGILSPGNGVGTLRIGNNVTFASGGNLSLEIDGDGSVADLLAVTGDLNLTNTDSLTLTLLNSMPTNNLILATYTGTLSGTFDSVIGLQNGWALDYGVLNAHAITLIVPEPTSVAMLVSGMGLLACSRRSRRNRI